MSMWDYIDAHPYLSFMYFMLSWFWVFLLVFIRGLATVTAASSEEEGVSSTIEVEDRSGLA